MRDAIQQEEQNTMLLAESDGCAVWQLRNETINILLNHTNLTSQTL